MDRARSALAVLFLSGESWSLCRSDHSRRSHASFETVKMIMPPLSGMIEVRLFGLARKLGLEGLRP